MSRRYDEREVAEMLRRATEPRSGTALERADGGDGLTLDQVMEIAAEAGIDPARIEEAASALGRPADASVLDAFLGAPTGVRFEAEYDVELDEEGRGEVVRLIRATLGAQGVVGGRGEDLEWMGQDGFGARNVNLYRTARGTRVEITGRFREAGSGAVGVTGVTGVVGAIGLAAAVSAGPAALLVAPLTLGAMYAIPRLTLGRVVRRETRKLAELADRLREMLAARSLAAGEPNRIEKPPVPPLAGGEPTADEEERT